MLHILWLIIKFILILLGVLLGLVLLLITLVLFCPVRYQGQGRKYDSDWTRTEGQIVISWLFRGISVAAYRKDGTDGITVRLLGIPLNNLIRFFQERSEKKKQRSRKRKKKQAKRKKQERKVASETENKTTDAPDIEEAVCEELEECQESVEEISEPEFQEVKTEEIVSDEEEDAILEEMLSQELEKEEAESESFQNSQSSGDLKKKGFLKKLLDKLSEIPRKVEAMKAAYRRIRNKAEWWNKFFHHPRVQAATSLVWKYAKGLLKHILPTKIWGQVTFGFSDPSITGRVLGLLGMSIPLHKNCVAVMPIFSGENIFEGEVHLKGRIYGIVLLKAAIAIYFNKNVKYAIKRARHGMHKEE